MLNEIIIPTNITVHLGRPNQNAQNITLPFRDYLKNVGSSEIYPTWPYEALKANIYCQMSLALNRIYTEWYPTQGYNFDITNSTSYDQAFVKNRNIFDSISEIVDEVIGSFLQMPYFLEPYYSEYCDGRKAQCPGFKQWGSVDLANRGYDAMQIVRYYYGDRIQLRYSNNVKAIYSSYPGTPQRIGSRGNDVFVIQELLNGIGVNYPNIPLIYPPDGIFGPITENSVKRFQSTFNLTSDGIVGKATWNRLSRIFVAVRRLAQLNSIGRLEGYFSGLFTGKTLRIGDVGMEVQQIQYWLSVIALNDNRINPVTVDSRFGNGLRTSVIQFQTYYGLIPDGLVGQASWNTIFNVYNSL